MIETLDFKKVVGALTELIMRTTGLTANQAKTVVYWATATYALPKLGKFPILAIQGPAGTGKTTILRILKEISFQPPLELIDGHMSNPTMRDTLAGCDTALIDEPDKIFEKWLINRYSRQSSKTSVKREGDKGWNQQEIDLFGATALHRRTPFRDVAVLSRTIVIPTKNKEGVRPFDPKQFKPFAESLKHLSDELDWENLDADQGSRIFDTWEPIVWIGWEDENWNTYADDEMNKARANLSLGQQEEPTQGVFSALLSIAVSEGGKVEDRVQIKQIVEDLRQSMKLNGWQVGTLLREMGLETKKAGGKQYVYTGGMKRLKEVGKRLQIDDEWLEEAA